MKKRINRVLSVFLALVIAISGIPASRAYAEDGGLYQVKFTRTDTGQPYIIMTTEPVYLSAIFRMTGLKDKIAATAPTFSASGFSTEADGDNWKISYSGDPLAVSGTMTVTVSGKTYTYSLETAAKGSDTWQNKQGKTITWVYDSTSKTLTLSGEGMLSEAGQGDDFGLDKIIGGKTEYASKDWLAEVPWKAWIHEIKTVKLESGITSIGQQAFRHHTALEEIQINGNAITAIGKGSFQYCSNLETLDLTNCTSLTTIGGTGSEGAFYESGLKTIKLSPSITSLPASLFDWDGCKLAKLNFSQLVNLTSIADGALKKEDTSQAITDSETGEGLNLNNQLALTSIGKNAFRNQTGLKPDLVIASPVLKTVGDGAFSSWDKNHCVLESLDLSACAALETVGKEAFLNQKYLAALKLPDAFTWFNKDAFKNCSALGLPSASIAYCAGGNGALYNVNSDGTAARVLNDGEDTLYWIPTAPGSDPLAAAVTIPYTGSEQALVDAPTLCPQTGSYAISYTLDGSAASGIPEAKDPGTYEVGYTVTLPDGTTSKSGTVSVTIAAKAIAGSMLSLDQTAFEYDGNTKTPVLTVKDGTYELVKDTDYTVDSVSVTSASDVADYSISVTGQGGYTGIASIPWSIKDTTDPEITGVTDGTTYGETVNFTVSDLRLSTVTLQKGSETPQNLAVSGGSASGTATENGTYTLTAKDLSGNTTTVTFTVDVKKPVTVGMLSLDQPSFEYDGNTKAPVLTVKDGTTELAEGTDYTVDASSEMSGTNVGSYAVSVTGQGGYTGTASISWSIKDTTDPKITGVTDGTTYGETVTFTVTDLRLSTVTLQKDSETPQDLAVSGGSASGSATKNGMYTLTAKDLSDNTTTITFTVAIPEPKTIVSSMLSLDEDSFEYDGNLHTVALTVKDGATELTEGTDYTVDASSELDGTDVGAYTVSVTGTGGYTGSASVSWSIKDTTKPEITGVTNGTEYAADVNFTVKDLRLASVTLQKDSEAAQDLAVSGGSASGTATEDGSYMLTATDLSGNETTVVFSINAPVPDPPVVPQADTPVFSPASGREFRTRLTVTISCDTPGAEIRYTTDGSDPDASNGIVYTSGAAIRLSRSTILKAIATADGYRDSEIAKASYTRQPREKDEEVIPDDGPPLADLFPFTDVPEDSYYRKAVEWAVSEGVTGGTSPTTFSPAAGATRAQAITFLWAASGAPEPKSAADPFKDVSERDYYYKAVLWAYENGITNGISADQFGADGAVTRGQVITFLWAASGAPEPAATENPFKDVPEDSYCYKPVLWAYEKGITAGTGEDTFSPDAKCLREQIVTFLYLCFGK